MILPISAAVLMLIVVVLLVRRSGLKIWHALACTMLGFYMASTSIAPSIHTLTTNVAGMLSGIKL
jgi:hypothetical protein